MAFIKMNIVFVVHNKKNIFKQPTYTCGVLIKHSWQKPYVLIYQRMTLIKNESEINERNNIQTIKLKTMYIWNAKLITRLRIFTWLKQVCI